MSALNDIPSDLHALTSVDRAASYATGLLTIGEIVESFSREQSWVVADLAASLEQEYRKASEALAHVEREILAAASDGRCAHEIALHFAEQVRFHFIDAVESEEHPASAIERNWPLLRKLFRTMEKPDWEPLWCKLRIERARAALSREQERGTAGQNKQRRKSRGRPRKQDRPQDEQIVAAWESGRYKRYADCGREFNVEAKEVELVVDRCRKREEREHNSR